MAARDSAPNQGRRIRVALSCTVCGKRNYQTRKPPKDGGKVLKLKKFCRDCKHHTVHVEAK